MRWRTASGRRSRLSYRHRRLEPERPERAGRWLTRGRFPGPDAVRRRYFRVVSRIYGSAALELHDEHQPPKRGAVSGGVANGVAGSRGGVVWIVVCTGSAGLAAAVVKSTLNAPMPRKTAAVIATAATGRQPRCCAELVIRECPATGLHRPQLEQREEAVGLRLIRGETGYGFDDLRPGGPSL